MKKGTAPDCGPKTHPALLCGVQKRLLLSPELSKPGELGPIRFIPEALRKRSDLGGTTMAGIDETARETFCDRLLERSDEVLKQSSLHQTPAQQIAGSVTDESSSTQMT